MDSKTIESYLIKIEELVTDENKIVTYKSVSRILGIHVNTAKQLLYTFLSKQKNGNSFPVSATYLLAGKLTDGSLSVTIVNEADLKSTYSKFVEVTSEHIYSIQKGKNVKEIKLFSGFNNEVQNIDSPRVIECSKSVIKDKKKPDCYIEDITNKCPKTAKVLEEKEKEIVNVKIEKSEIESNVKITDEKCTKSPKKISPTSDKSKAKTEKGQGNAKKPKGNIASFFANRTQKITEKSVSSSNDKDDSLSSKENKTSIFTSKNDTVKTVDKSNVDSKPEKSKFRENSKEKKERNKRKRIQVLSDSEESDSDNEELPPDEEEHSESPLPSAILEEKIEETEEVPRNKRKKRKVVDKTIESEDGYIETKKEVVFETDSEDDETTTSVKEDSGRKKSKIEAEQGSEKTRATGSGKKQSSLLTFFKKN